MTEREKEKLSNTRNGTSLVEVEGGREREREREEEPSQRQTKMT